ncbi:MAG: N-acetylneuraminate synthase family protein, partial [Dehalococcoidia bacterium]
MIVEMSRGATKEQVDHVVERARSLGFEVQLNIGTEKTVVAILGSDTGKTSSDLFAVLPGVEGVSRIMKPYKLASREFKPRASKIDVNGVEIGGERVVIMAGPCAVEGEKQLMETAKAVKKAGAAVVRGGAFKPRTSPFAFQGLEKDALKMLARVKSDLGIPVITEVVDVENIKLVAEHADILQIGARNMQNFALLKELAKVRHPILLKRGFSATVTEWLTAADYLLAEGNKKV